jgi:hypothetical protein
MIPTSDFGPTDISGLLLLRCAVLTCYASHPLVGEIASHLALWKL